MKKIGHVSLITNFIIIISFMVKMKCEQIVGIRNLNESKTSLNKYGLRLLSNEKINRIFVYFFYDAIEI